MTSNLTHEPSRKEPDSPRRREILAMLERWDTLYRSDIPAALALARAALARARRARFGEGIALALHHVGYSQYLELDRDGALEHLEASRRVCEELGDRAGMARAIRSIGLVYAKFGDLVIAYRLYIESIGLYDEAGLQVEGAIVRNSLGLLFKYLGAHDQALETLGRALEVFEREDRRLQIAMVLHNIASVRMERGEYREARGYLERAIPIREAIGDRRGEMLTRVMLAWCLGELRAFDDALRHARRAVEVCRALGNAMYEPATVALVGMIHRRRGEPEPARRHLEEASRLADLVRPSVRPGIEIELGELHVGLGELEKGIGRHRRALEIARDQGSTFWEGIASVELSRALELKGDPVGALAHARRALELSADFGRDAGGWGWVGGVQILTGDVATKRTEVQQLYAAFLREMIDRKQEELTAGASFLAAQQERIDTIRKEMAELLPTLPEPGRERVAELARRLDGSDGASPGWEAFERRFRETHPGFLRALAGRAPEMTPTELRVCSLLRANLSSKQIAALLSISPKSVDIYRYRARRKLHLAPEENLVSFLASL